MNRPTSRLLALLLVLTLAPGVAPSQDTASEEAAQVPEGLRGLGEAIEVRLVNIDVYVRDKDGNPITGLTKDDFLLFIDGKPASISNFYAVSSETDPVTDVEADADPEGESSGEEPTAEPAPRTAERVSSPPPADQRLHVVVYIDNYNLTQFNRNRVLRELRTFLREELSPDDQVMLATYDRELHLRYPFTGRPEEVNRALLEIEDISAQRIHRDRERTDLIARVLEDTEGDYTGAAITDLFAYAGSMRNDMEFTLKALGSVVDNLAGSPGRKAIVYVSDGLPMIAAEDLFYFINQQYERSLSLIEMAEFDLSRQFMEIAARANANRVTFYTIDARGLTVLGQGTVDQAVEGPPGRLAYIDSIRINNLQHPLQLMADETGGRAIVNANRIGGDLLKIGQDFRNYYSLGYDPVIQDEGRYHQIEVKLKDPPKGATVRHRNGYRNKSVEARMADRTFSALNLDLQQNEIGARLSFGQPEPRDDGYFSTPVVLEIPFENLTLIEQDGAHRGRLSLWMAAKDDKDRSTGIQTLPVDIAIPSDRIDETEGQLYRYELTLTFEQGYHDLAVAMRDELGGGFAVLRRGILVDVRS